MELTLQPDSEVRQDSIWVYLRTCPGITVWAPPPQTDVGDAVGLNLINLPKLRTTFIRCQENQSHVFIIRW